MALETFAWSVLAGPSGPLDMRYREAQFGDGYSQAVGDGINNLSESWQIQLGGSTEEVRPALEFLRRHGGWKSFVWTSPSGLQALFRGRELQQASPAPGLLQLSATFTQVGDYYGTLDLDFIAGVYEIGPNFY